MCNDKLATSHVQGKLCWVLQCLAVLLGYGNTVKRIANAPTLEEQRQVGDWWRMGPACL